VEADKNSPKTLRGFTGFFKILLKKEEREKNNCGHYLHLVID